MAQPAVQPNSTLSTPSSSGKLTVLQAQAAFALADGRTINQTAAVFGIDRAAIGEWLRTSQAFRDAMNWADQQIKRSLSSQRERAKNDE